MKANHIPVTERLQNRIDKLNESINYGEYWTSKKYYPQCKFCGVTNVQETISGHHKGCKVPGILKEINYYQSLLKDNYVSKNI